ncbi:MAG: hypothetical protein QM654_12915 [Dysgonamonadaceae bacterium]
MLIQSKDMSQAEFIVAILRRDTENIFRAQSMAVSNRIWLSGKDLKAKQRKNGIGKRSGRLENTLSSPDFVLRAEGESFKVAANYPLYIRFLDMKSKGNWQIYNRQIWGILYNNSLKEIKYRYGQAIVDKVGNALRNANPSTRKK